MNYENKIPNSSIIYLNVTLVKTAYHFAGNRALCGRPLGSSCDPTIPPPDAEPNLHPADGQPTGEADSSQGMSSGARTAIIIVCVVLFLLLLLLLLFFIRRKNKDPTPQLGRAVVTPSDDEATIGVAAPSLVASVETAAAGASPPKKVDHHQPGKLTFVRDDRQKFDLQDLMRASAEVLGSGNFGASYKAVLVDGEALVVKRFKQMNNIAKEDFHEHMRRIGRLKHPNLLPLVAYLYRKEEKLLVFDFVHNGSLAANLHGQFSFNISCQQLFNKTQCLFANDSGSIKLQKKVNAYEDHL